MEIGIDQRGGRVVNFTRLSNKMLIDQSVIENLVSFQFHVRNGIRDTAACLVDGLFFDALTVRTLAEKEIKSDFVARCLPVANKRQTG